MTFNALEKSFNYLRNNLVLFIPDIVVLITMYLLLYVIYLYTGVADLMTLLSSAEESAVTDILKTYLSENLVDLIISAAVYIFVTFMIGVTMAVLKYSMVRQVLSAKKVSLITAWKEKSHYFWFVVFLRILIFAIGLLALIIVALISGLIYLILNPLTTQSVALSLAGGLAVPLTVLALLFVKLALFFRYPIMFLDAVRNPFSIIKRAYRFSKNNKFYVLVTWLVIFALGIISSIVLWFANILFNSGLSLISIATITIIAALLISVANMLIKLAIELWGTIFMFIRYKQKK